MFFNKYTNQGRSFIRPFSSEPPIVNADGIAIDLTSTRELESLTVRQLKDICKQLNRKLKANTRKKEIIQLIMTAVTTKKAVLGQDNTNQALLFPLELDAMNRINISVWFRQVANKNQRITRILEAKKFKALIVSYCKITNQSEDDVIVQTATGEWFLTDLLALRVAAGINSDLECTIYNFYLNNKTTITINNILKSTGTQNIKELIAKFNKPTRLTWPQFDVSFAYYILYNEESNIVKAGAVGIHNDDTSDKSLDRRLNNHRSSFIGYKLLKVFVFNDSDNIQFFEKAMKRNLKKYSVGNSKTGLEQYQCKSSNTGDIVINEANDMFERLKFEESSFGHIMEHSLVDNYNAATQNNTSIALSVPASFDND